MGRSGDDPEATELLEALLSESPAFGELWQRHEVSSRGGSVKRFVHPLVGELSLTCDVLVAETLTESLVVFSAAAGTEAAEKLKLLAVVGGQDFAEPAR